MPKETFQHKNRELHRSLVVIQQQYVATLEVRHYGSTWPRPHPLGRLHGATSVITRTYLKIAGRSRSAINIG